MNFLSSTFVGQRRQCRAEGPGPVRVQLRWQRDLQGRHIGRWVQVAQRHPGAVVQAAALVGLGRPAGIPKQGQRTLRQCRVAVDRIVDVVKGRSKPPKSWIVRGRDTRPTRGRGVIQCGDTTSTARGRGSARPSAASLGPATPGSIAKVGAPCEMKRLGRRLMVTMLLAGWDG